MSIIFNPLPQIREEKNLWMNGRWQVSDSNSFKLFYGSIILFWIPIRDKILRDFFHICYY